MVNYSPQTLDRVFSALADPTRRGILATLARGESNVTDLAKPFKMSLPAISKHLKVLERAGLIRKQKNGRVRHCRIDAEPMKDAATWIAFYQKFWEEKLVALADYVENSIQQEANNDDRRK